MLTAILRLSGTILRLVARLAIPATCDSFRRQLVDIDRRTRQARGTELPRSLVSALIVAEDKRFFAHYGFDSIAVVRAAFSILLRNKWSGASTIEQQLVRVVTGSYERTIRRKIREILLAATIRTYIPKTSVLHIYLLVAYFGWQMNGLREACARLDIQLESITPRNSAELIARLKYPEPQFPTGIRKSQIARRTDFILSLLSGQKRQRRAVQGANEDAAILPF